MTTRLPLLPLNGQEGGLTPHVDEKSSRLLIVAPLADIYSGVGNPSLAPLPWVPGVSRSTSEITVST